VYPSRTRPVRDVDDLYVVRLVIDTRGLVDGARLVRGKGGRRDQHALDSVWRFRYLPALDHAGTPVRAEIDQRFMVQ